MKTYNIVEDDPRGLFAELLKAKWGQLSYLEVQPNTSRGGHYHKRKTEVFILLDGTCNLLLKNNGNLLDINMRRFKRYIVPASTVHTLTNPSEATSKILIFCDECYDPENGDTYK